jgi:hypothetical protein
VAAFDSSGKSVMKQPFCITKLGRWLSAFELTLCLIAVTQLTSVAGLALLQYSIGDPTNEEQLFVELINRARANPTAEGLRLAASTDTDVLGAYRAWNVDLAVMTNEFAAMSPAPPLSISPALTEAARGHSRDMLAHAYSGHTNWDGTTLLQRILAQGYIPNTAAENVYAYGRSVVESHTGFEVDWGTAPDGSIRNGMQYPRGHRENTHNPAFREVGLGAIRGVKGTVGPLITTQNFGSPSSSAFGSRPLITGVVYDDLNGNGFYDVGEGMGGVTVTVIGSSFFAVTARSGGYSIPVPGNGRYPVAFSLPPPSWATLQRTATVNGGQNVKVDCTPTQIRISHFQMGAGGQIQIAFAVASGTASGFILQTAQTPNGPWAADAAATVRSLGSGQFSVVTETSGLPHLFYRIEGN